MIRTREIYASSNGDRWLVGVESETGRVFVEHRANIPSGAHTAVFDLETFLKGPAGSPEHQALMRLVRASIAEEDADENR